MVATGNLGLAFGLVFGAALCTALGATLVLFTKLADNRMLSASLGLSAGVMIYVSFVEIFMTKSVQSFEETEYGDAAAYRYATFCFFAGMVLTFILESGLALVLRYQRSRKHAGVLSQVKDTEMGATRASEAVEIPRDDHCEQPDVSMLTAACSNQEPLGAGVISDHMNLGFPVTNTGQEVYDDVREQQDLIHMGLLSALAIGIHNLPEGIATFVGALANMKAGITIAVAIALHNIPEGIIVAMPVYYATGSKWKAFLWASVPGLAEPVGGLLAFLVIHGTRDDPLTYGILFGLVAGIMVYISVKELLPIGLRYDKEDRFVTSACFFGMAVMAASLLLFQI